MTTIAPPRLVAVVHGPPLKRFVRVGPAEVAYVEAGDPDGPPVVLLHGFPTSSYLWRNVIPELGDDVRVLAPDLPGLGDTVVSPYEDLGAPMQAELLLGLLDRLGAERVALVATGQAGAIAQQVAAIHPGRLSHLALVASVSHDAWTTPFWSPRFGLDHPGLVAVSRALGLPRRLEPVRSGLLAAAHPGTPLAAQVVEEHLRPLHDADGWERARRFLVSGDPEATVECLPALRSLPVPAVVVWGADDPLLSPSWGVRLAGVLGCPFELLPFCGHLVPEERPAELAAVVRALLGRTS